MRRRDFLAGLLLTATAPVAAAEQSGKGYWVAILGPGEEPRFSEMASGLKRGLRASDVPRRHELRVGINRHPRPNVARIFLGLIGGLHVLGLGID